MPKQSVTGFILNNAIAWLDNASNSSTTFPDTTAPGTTEEPAQSPATYAIVGGILFFFILVMVCISWKSWTTETTPDNPPAASTSQTGEGHSDLSASFFAANEGKNPNAGQELQQQSTGNPNGQKNSEESTPLIVTSQQQQAATGGSKNAPGSGYGTSCA